MSEDALESLEKNVDTYILTSPEGKVIAIKQFQNLPAYALKLNSIFAGYAESDRERIGDYENSREYRITCHRGRHGAVWYTQDAEPLVLIGSKDYKTFDPKTMVVTVNPDNLVKESK